MLQWVVWIVLGRMNRFSVCRCYYEVLVIVSRSPCIVIVCMQ